MERPQGQQLTEAGPTWLAERRRRQASLQQCEQVLQGLPTAPPGSMHQLLKVIGDSQNPPVSIRVEKHNEPALPTALLVPYPTEIVIYVRWSDRLTLWRCLAHELAHFLLGHLKKALPLTAQRRLWFPDLDDELLKQIWAFSEGQITTPAEWDAEALGSRLLAIVLHGYDPGPRDPGQMEGLPFGGRKALYGQFWQLRPLWRELVTAEPNTALFPPRLVLADLARVGDLEFRVLRQLLEILDVRRLLRDRLNPAVGAMARELAQRKGLRERQVDAVAEAAMLAAAARATRQAHREGRDLSQGAAGVACAASYDVLAELAWLRLVADAYRTPIVRKVLTQTT